MASHANRLARPGLRLESLEERATPVLIGALDPSFGANGKVALAGVQFEGVAAQPDGKLVVVGTTSTNDLLVARYNANGSIDTSFDGDGSRVIDFGGIETASDIAVQSDGKIVVAGTSTIIGAGAFAVARLNPNGSLDSSFDGDGMLFIDFSGVNDMARAVAIQPDGKIVVAGDDFANTLVARINPADGSLDNTFDGDGKLSIDLYPAIGDTANDVAIQPGGKIVLTGSAGETSFGVARLNSDGSLDNAFDGDGTRTISFPGFGFANGNAIAFQGGNIVIAGDASTTLLASQDFAIARLNADGSLDSTFDGDGRQTIDFGGTDKAEAVVAQPGGKLLVAGYGDGDFAIIRLTPAGALDTTFDGDGKVIVDAGSEDIAADAVVSPRGRMVIAGSGTGSLGELVRVVIGLDQGRNLAVGGSEDGKATVFVPDGSGQYSSLAGVAPFGNTGTNVRSAVADVNGDGVEDTIVVTGPGTPIRFAVVSGVDSTTMLVAPTAPFSGSENFTGGGFAAAADFDGDGRAEMIFTPDQGGGPRVTIFSLNLDGSLATRANFFGIDDPNFRGGARAAAGDVNNEGTPDLAVAAGFLGGPRIALFDGTTIFGTPTRLINDFFAFPEDAATLRNGAFVAVGDVDGDGPADLIFGGGPGGAPRVYILSGAQISTGNIALTYATPVANFFVAGNAADRGGVRVAAKDADGDNKADVAAASGEGSPANVRVYLGKNFTSTTEPTTVQDLEVFGGAVLANGVYVG